jgi:hypothetical protein
MVVTVLVSFVADYIHSIVVITSIQHTLVSTMSSMCGYALMQQCLIKQQSPILLDHGMLGKLGEGAGVHGPSFVSVMVSSAVEGKAVLGLGSTVSCVTKHSKQFS